MYNKHNTVSLECTQVSDYNHNLPANIAGYVRQRLSYHTVTARHATSVEILSTNAQLYKIIKLKTLVIGEITEGHWKWC